MPEAVAETLTASDGMQLCFRHYHCDRKPTGIVIGLHGIQSHSGWYDYSSQQLTEAGFEVYFADRRGSGQNGRPRGHADHGMRLLNDVRQLVRLVRREHPTVPLTLLGLSWGGKIAAAFAATYPNLIDRLALLYPGLTPQIGPTLWQRFQLWFARSHDVRMHPVAIPLQDVSLFTDNQEKQQYIRHDPLALEYITSGLLNAGRDLDQTLHRFRKQLTHPILLMLAGNDRIIDNDRTQKLVDSFPSAKRTTCLYPDSSHTLEFSDQRDEFVNDLVAWLSEPV